MNVGGWVYPFVRAKRASGHYYLPNVRLTYESEFRKYLIGACEGYPLSWAFEEGFKSVGSSMSVSALVREISDSVYGPARLKYPPAFHLALAKNSLGEITIPRIESDYDHPWDSTDTSDESSPEKEE